MLFFPDPCLSWPSMHLTAKKDLDVCETFNGKVTKVLWRGRRAGAKTFYIAGDFNVELRLLCTDDDDVPELNEMYCPLCWQGCDNGQGGFKKLMWYELTKEFHAQTNRERWKRNDDAAGLNHRAQEDI